MPTVTPASELLKEWLASNPGRATALRKQYPKSGAIVWRWQHGQAMPNYRNRLQIEQATGGAVPAHLWASPEEIACRGPSDPTKITLTLDEEAILLQGMRIIGDFLLESGCDPYDSLQMKLRSVGIPIAMIPGKPWPGTIPSVKREASMRIREIHRERIHRDLHG